MPLKAGKHRKHGNFKVEYKVFKFSSDKHYKTKRIPGKEGVLCVSEIIR